MRPDTRWTKALRDLLLRKGRTALALGGLVVGLWGIASVAVALAILRPDLRANFVETDPPSIVIETRGATPERLRALDAVPGVAAIEDRPLVQGLIEMDDDLWLPILLFAVDDFEAPRVARFEPDSGAWPPPAGTLLVERDGEVLVTFLRGFAGKPPLVPSERGAVGVRLAGAPPFEARIAGSVFDPALAPSRMERTIYGYAGRATVEGWLGRPLGNRLLVSVSVDPEDRPEVVAVARRLVAALEQAGSPADGWRVLAYEHPHAFQMLAVLVLLGSLATLALLLAAVLVVQLVGTLLARQVRQIGVMKALGGTTRQIAAGYFGGMALLGLAAGAVAVPLGVLSGRAVAAAISGFLNFAVLTPAPPAWLVAALVALSAAVPVLAAAVPVLHTARRPVQEALARHGVEALAPPRRDPLDLRLPIAVTLALRNAGRHPRRLAITVLTLALGTSAFLAAVNLRASLLETADVVERTQLHDTSIVLGRSLPDRTLLDWFAARPNVDRVEAWTVTSASLVAAGEEPDGSPAALRVVPAGTRAIAPTVLAGRWLDPARPRDLVVSQRLLAERPDLTVGGTYRLVAAGGEMDVSLVGVVKEFGPGALYVQEELYDREIGRAGLGNVVLVSLRDRSAAGRRELREDVRQVTEDPAYGVKQVVTPNIAALIIRGHLEVIVFTLALVALSMMAISGLGVGSSLAVSVAERSREIGVLRAIGGRPITIRTLLAWEAALAALLAWAASAALTVPVSRFAIERFGAIVVGYPFDYRTSWLGVLAALGGALVIALAASLGASRRAARMPVHEVLAYE